MCDTIVAVPPATKDGGVWFGKNSDREPGEAQIVEHLPARKFASPSKLQCTYVELPQAAEIYEVVLSRPFWMWGAEIGANSRGLAIGNEAVFTKLPVPKTGLTGMDLLRLALERTATAREALETITRLIAEIGQGGLCGYRHKGFRYHNSFIIADPTEAWVLETADKHWAAERVRGVRTISNVLTIGKDFDLISDEAFTFAKAKGWCKSANDFDFAKAFGDPFYSFTSAGDIRRACTHRRLMLSDGKIGRADFFAALRDHAGQTPEAGLRLQMPCGHASWMKTRQSGQTTSSMVSRLDASGSMHWLTGTSSPCLSLFKPFVLGGEVISTGAPAGEVFDSESLWWRHERLHRLTLGDYARRRAMTEIARRELEAKFLSFGNGSMPTVVECQQAWDEHQAILPNWINRITREARRDRRWLLTRRYWQQQNQLDQMPNGT
ncbi:MAG: C69 family dipeptidase [Acidobacteriota bacterium]|nr:C69 family dipeptidase [Acidobacteriota bacterium]